MTYDQDVAKRFKFFRKKFIHNNSKEAAKLLNCVQSKISYIESGQRTVDFDIVNVMIRKFNLNADWLALGLGQPHRLSSEKPNLITDIADIKADLDAAKAQIKLLTNYIKKSRS